jgi:hypothetical protein
MSTFTIVGVHAGMTTFYDYGGIGACGKPITKGMAICALSSSEFAGGKHCGKVLNFRDSHGRSGSCEIRDECPPCQKGQIDMTLAAFLKVSSSNFFSMYLFRYTNSYLNL